jgi:hypothetical protein
MITPATSPEPAITTAPDVAAGDATQRWAICCSGGGIRSASYRLGALQLIAVIGAYLRVLLLSWLASALVVMVGFAVALRSVKDGAAAGIGAGQIGLVSGALAVILIARVLTDANRISQVEEPQSRDRPLITHILVLDASGDRADSFSTLGGSIALARCDAAAEITLDPTEMIYPLGPGLSALDQGQVVRPWATGSVTDRDGHPLCSIVVCKLGWWKTAPWDVRAYAAGHSNDPTVTALDQLFDSAEFDAYRQLGWSAVDAAISRRALPPGNQPQVASWVGARSAPRTIEAAVHGCRIRSGIVAHRSVCRLAEVTLACCASDHRAVPRDFREWHRR